MSQTGVIGEEVAKEFLLRHGYSILSTNFRRPFGEIDIVAEKNGILRFIEVKSSKFFGDTAFNPEIRVNRKKMRNLKRICEAYIREVNVSQDRPWGIDVISVILGEDMSVVSVNLLENAVFQEQY